MRLISAHAACLVLCLTWPLAARADDTADPPPSAPGSPDVLTAGIGAAAGASLTVNCDTRLVGALWLRIDTADPVCFSQTEVPASISLDDAPVDTGRQWCGLNWVSLSDPNLALRLVTGGILRVQVTDEFKQSRTWQFEVPASAVDAAAARVVATCRAALGLSP